MTRADRLLTLVAELRAAAPGPLSAAELARRLGVSERTVRRDLELLGRGGLPVRFERGRGYTLAPEVPSPAMSEADSLIGPVHDTLAEAVRTRRVVRLHYTDQAGKRTRRDVEAHGLVIAPYGEYLVGWCRLRDDPRMFRLERIGAAYLTAGEAGLRDLDDLLAALRVPTPRLPADQRPGQPPPSATSGGPTGTGTPQRTGQDPPEAQRDSAEAGRPGTSRAVPENQPVSEGRPGSRRVSEGQAGTGSQPGSPGRSAGRRGYGSEGPRGPAGALRARAWTLDRLRHVRLRLAEAAGEVRGKRDGAARLRAVLGHLAEWTRWQVAAVRAVATGTELTFDGRRPAFPPEFEGDLPYETRERMIQDAMALRSLGEVARDLDAILDSAGHFAADCDDVLWEDPLPDPAAPGRHRSLADLLAGWGGPLSHIEWHLDRLTEKLPEPVHDPDTGEEIWIIDRCPLQI